MKKIILHSPAISSMNIGDHIITESAKNGISELIDEAFVVEVSTHLPTSWYYMRNLKNSDYNFVLGSNLIKSTFLGFKRQWDITLRSSFYLKPVILIGAGWWQYGNEPNIYTKWLLKSILSKEHIHSVRDEYTLTMLKKIGIENVVNTSCPTMWNLTKEHCETIPRGKSLNVVFTLTDYNKDRVKDQRLIEILMDNYDKVSYWPQGTGDFEYINTFPEDLVQKIEIINPNLGDYEKVFVENEIDYIGTRLHGGIKALQRAKRTFIISIDNRAREKAKSFNIPIIERENIEELHKMINSNFKTDIIIPLDQIELWKKQFK